MEVLNLYEDYTGNLDRLVGLITPYARRLEEQLAERPWLMESLGAYWAEQFQTISPESFCAGSKMGYRSPPVNPHRRVCFSLMACTELQFETQNSVLHPGRSLYVFGCSIAAVCSQQMFGDDTEHRRNLPHPGQQKAGWSFFCAWPRTGATVSSWRWRPSATPATCPAASPPCPSAVCWKQEQEQSRTYYAADLPAISRFLQEFHDLLARRQER